MSSDNEFQSWIERLERARRTWSDSAAELKPHLLLAGADVVEAETWLNTRAADLSEDQRAFIVASITQWLTQRARAATLAKTSWRSRAGWMAEFGAVIVIAVSVLVVQQSFSAYWKRLGEEQAAAEREAQRQVEKVRHAQQVNEEREQKQRQAEAAAMRGIHERAAEMQRKQDEAKRTADIARAANQAFHEGRREIGVLLALESLASAADAQGGYGAEFEDAARREATTALLRAVRSERDARLPPLDEGMTREGLFADHGRLVATTAKDNVLRLIDARDGRELIAIDGHGDRVFSAAINPSHIRLAAASGDDAARIWGSSGKQVSHLWGHEAPVVHTAFSADGRIVVTGSQDRTARVWDAETGKNLAVLRGHDSTVVKTVINSTGTRIATASDDQTVRLWDAATGKQIAVMREHQAPVTQAQFSADGSRLLTFSWDGTARLWNAADGKEVGVLHGKDSILKLAAFSPGSDRIVSVDENGHVAAWDAHTGALAMEFSAAVLDAREAVLSPDGRWLAATTWSGSAHVWDAKSGAFLANLAGDDLSVAAIAFEQDSKTLLAVADGRKIYSWPVAPLPELEARLQASVGRCLTDAERRDLASGRPAPEWCGAKRQL